MRRKEEDADFEEKRMSLGITAVEGEEEEVNKDNSLKRRDVRSRLKKDKDVPPREVVDDERYRRETGLRRREARESSPRNRRVSEYFLMTAHSKDFGVPCYKQGLIIK